MKNVKVIVVDDSAFMRKAIAELIESEPTFEVIAKLRDGRELIEKINEYNPDIITLDVHMSDLDGLSTLKELKKLKKEYPVIMLSGSTTEGSAMTLECLDNGAISFITKPSGSISLDIAKIQEDLINQIKSIVSNKHLNKVTAAINNSKSKDISINNDRCISNDSDVIVEKSINNYSSNIDNDNPKVIIDENKEKENIVKELNIKRVEKVNKKIPRNKKIDAVVIGASTGGPKALQVVLTELPSDLGVPVFVVQHMPEGFTKVFAERLDKLSKMKVVECEDGMDIENNTIYIAKGGSHMTISKQNTISLNKQPAIWGVRPAVDKLFDSAVQVYGENLLSVVLTGMGKDGANGTANVKNNGGITISEDESTCTIYGMPKAAYETGKVDLVLPLNQVCDKITKIVKRI